MLYALFSHCENIKGVIFQSVKITSYVNSSIPCSVQIWKKKFKKLKKM